MSPDGDGFYAWNQSKLAPRPRWALRFVSGGCLAQLSSWGLAVVCGHLPLPRASGNAQQRTLGDDQIGQGEEDVQLRRVLPQPPVAHLAVFEEVLDDVSRAQRDRQHEVLPAGCSGAESKGCSTSARVCALSFSKRTVRSLTQLSGISLSLLRLVATRHSTPPCPARISARFSTPV